MGYFPFNEVGAPRTGHPRHGPSDVLGVFPLSSASVLSSARALGRMWWARAVSVIGPHNSPSKFCYTSPWAGRRILTSSALILGLLGFTLSSVFIAISAVYATLPFAQSVARGWLGLDRLCYST